MSLISRLHHIFQGTHENEYDGTIMEFEDPEVKKYLVANIGGENGITNPEFGVEGVKGIAGEVTYEQVLACKKVDFLGNSNIRRFNELEYFKNLETAKFERSSIEEVSLPYMTISNGFSFNECSELKKLTTRYGLEITNAAYLFYNCTSLTTLDTSKWDLSNLVDGRDMFYNCTSLTTLDTSKWNLSNLVDGRDMFKFCGYLQSLDTSKWNLSNLSNGGSMFNGCTSLQTIDTSKWNLSNLSNGSSMFNGCTSLQTLDTSKWNLSNLVDGYRMFAICTSLVSIDLSDKLENCKYSEQILYYCTNLETAVGNHTETDNVRLLIGRSKSLNISELLRINLATVNAIIRGVASSPDKKLTLILPEPVKSQVTEEYRKILEYKNWEIN